MIARSSIPKASPISLGWIGMSRAISYSGLHGQSIPSKQASRANWLVSATFGA